MGTLLGVDPIVPWFWLRNAYGLMICRQCHNTVHNIASNEVLASQCLPRQMEKFVAKKTPKYDAFLGTVFNRKPLLGEVFAIEPTGNHVEYYVILYFLTCLICFYCIFILP